MGDIRGVLRRCGIEDEEDFEETNSEIAAT
jgi:hypothetical protein